MALSVDDMCDAQIEVEAYHRLQQLQGKHVPKLLGYGQIGQGFCVATSYIEACQKHCWLLLIHYLRPLGLTGVVHEAVESSAFQTLSQSLWYFCHMVCVLPASTSLCCLC